MQRVSAKKIALKGQTGALLQLVTEHWLLGLRESNPALLDIFADRDNKPYRKMEPWHGEFVGKYLTGAHDVYLLTQDQRLYDYALGVIDELLTFQDEDGYLGCFAKECHLTGGFHLHMNGGTWDAWNHYHIMYGLLLWHELTGDQRLFVAVEKIADLFLSKFYDGNPSLLSMGSSEMNLAVYHVFGILYRKTKNAAYLAFAKEIEVDFSKEGAGNYIAHALAGREFYACPKPRWESMHIILGVVEMYRNTGEESYLTAAKQIFYSILKTDVHNTGAFSTDEQAVGHPYQNGAIETCCVIAYNALAMEIFALTGDTAILDFLERSHYNAVLGMHSPTGKWTTYDTPMEGTRCANYHTINFQSRPGSPNLNCCSVNAPRGLAGILHWMLTEEGDTTFLHFYEDAEICTEDGLSLVLQGGYPANNQLKIAVDSGNTVRKLAFRIPAWSKNTTVFVGGEQFSPKAGSYFVQERVWQDTVTITFDFTPYCEAGGMEYTGMSSIFVGPVLYGFDLHDNRSFDFENPPVLSSEELACCKPIVFGDKSIRLLFASGLILKDFYHLGQSGSAYKTWLSVK